MKCLCIYFAALICIFYGRTVGAGLARWHNLQDRLDLKKKAENVYSPTARIMVNQLWDKKTVSGDKYPGLIEVDMELTHEQRKRWTLHGFFFEATANAVNDPWPKKTVKYRFSDSEKVKDKTVVVIAMKEWTSRTPCVKFVETKSGPEKDVLLIVQRKLAFASVGYRKERKQHILSLPEIAQTKNVVMHLLGHVLGLPHLHSRPDRDRFINWFTPNLELFDIMFVNQKLDCPYDYSSLMHYDTYAFTMGRNGEMSFEVPDIPWSDKKSIQDTILRGRELWNSFFNIYMLGRWTTPSVSDIVRVENGYKCPLSQACIPYGYDYSDIHMMPLPDQLENSDIYKLLRRVTEGGNDFVFNTNDFPAGQNVAVDMLYTFAGELTDDYACDRMLTLVQPAQRPTREQMSFWLLSGCTWMQIDVFDYRWDFHDLICASDFARMQRKAVFTSVNTRLYVRMHRLDHPIAKTMQDGFMSAMGFQDFICSGHATSDPPCQGVPDNDKARGFHFDF